MGSRKKTRPIKVGPLTIGGDSGISIQTMWKKPVHSISPGLIDEIQHLKALGCDIIRFAVPDLQSAETIGKLCSRLSIPAVADIHFDYRIALSCMDYPFSKIRINPGNIGAEWKVREVAAKAKDKQVPIRIGVNSGSLPLSLSGKEGAAEAMVKAAESEIEILESLAFSDIIISLKSSDIETTVQANQLFSAEFDYPLHIGITEAGPLITGIVKNSIGIARLLQSGIGDTIRVSLSSHPADEIIAGRDILIAENIYERGLRIISCPTCGRTTFDVQKFFKDNRDFLYSFQKKATVAVMGCPVNGPGEAKEADIGVTGSGNAVILFRHGIQIARVSYDDAVKRFREELENL
jgi:(E)-4-hydroxy-3-methylbut-2-enyl-diphosphate synthase